MIRWSEIEKSALFIMVQRYYKNPVLVLSLVTLVMISVASYRLFYDGGVESKAEVVLGEVIRVFPTYGSDTLGSIVVRLLESGDKRKLGVLGYEQLKDGDIVLISVSKLPSGYTVYSFQEKQGNQ